MTLPRSDPPLAAAFRDFVKASDFPCVGAKAALSRGLMRIIIARDMRSAWNDVEIAPWGIGEDDIPTAFNCFMNVPVNGETGAFTVKPPLSKAGDRVVFEAETDLVLGLTACSALQSNGGSFKPIVYEVSG